MEQTIKRKRVNRMVLMNDVKGCKVFSMWMQESMTQKVRVAFSNACMSTVPYLKGTSTVTAAEINTKFQLLCLQKIKAEVIVE